jgi:hypothetical protein
LTRARSHQNEIVAGLPTYFEQTGYQNPGDAFNGPFQKIEETKLHAFDWLATQPRQQHAFNVIMGMSRIRGTVPWYEAIPLDKKLPTASPSETLLVDVGGGVGHDLIGIRKSYPSLVGKMVVQDIPSHWNLITNPRFLLSTAYTRSKSLFFGQCPS